MERCPWAVGDYYEEYHDSEWGVPLTDAQMIFEFLLLEGAQAGLSWSTILKRRQGYREAYFGFDPEIIASFTEDQQALLLSDTRIIRNRAKVAAFVGNAQAWLKLCSTHDPVQYFWDFVDGKPLVNEFKSLSDIPAATPIAEKLSKDLKARGFKFVGPTICYAHMQATGMVNDHLLTCPRWQACQEVSIF